MSIPFKAGLTEKQRMGIVQLVEEKATSEWSDQDRANWDYATNKSPLPVKANKTLFVDLGHSSRFPGASGIKSEVLWNRSIWSHLKLKINRDKWNVVLVPESYSWTDLTSNLNLIHRISFINKRCKDGDWVLSIHGNAAVDKSVRGVTTCYMGGSEYMRGKAIALSSLYSQVTGVPLWGGGAFDDRRGRYGRIGMVRDTRPPALLIEAGFVTNEQDMQINPDAAAQAIADWLNRF